MSPRSNQKKQHLVSGQLQKNTWPRWAVNLSPWYGHVILVSDTLFWQVSVDHNMDVHRKPRLYVSLSTCYLDYIVYQQATGTMILLVYVESIEWSNRLHKWNEEYESRNRHNVECFLWRCTIFRLAKPAFFRYSVNFTLDVFYVAYYRKYVKLFDSVN